MYTIKEAAARTGVPIALLRAWERRYGVVTPTRTAAGYRLYDDAALEKLRTMRALVADGWGPSAAAAAVIEGTAPIAGSVREDAAQTGGSAKGVAVNGSASTAAGGEADMIRSFVDAATALDSGALERILDAMFAAGTFEHVADRLILPALAAIGDAWADARVSVAGEHAASQAILRRLAAAFLAAGREAPTSGAILVGLPPAARHELGALAFAIGARRAGLPIVYLGPDLPASDWVAAARTGSARAAVIGVPTAADVTAAVDVVEALAGLRPLIRVAIGGHGAAATAARLADGARAGAGRPRRAARAPLVLPDDLPAAVDALAAAMEDASRNRTTSA